MNVLSSAEEAREIDMMSSANKWPLGWILPLKHRTRQEPNGHGFALMGFMLLDFSDVDMKRAVPKVYIGSMDFQIMGQSFEDLAVEEFKDFKAIVAAGWRVD